jgi:hypothetical protein
MTANSGFVRWSTTIWRTVLLLSEDSSETDIACGRWRTGCRHSRRASRRAVRLRAGGHADA